MLTPVRQVLYIWETRTGTLINVLDAHFRRILRVKPVFVTTNFAIGDGLYQEQQMDSSQHKFITASLDRSIKVWNLKFIRENVYSIDSHEKQIERVMGDAKLF